MGKYYMKYFVLDIVKNCLKVNLGNVAVCNTPICTIVNRRQFFLQTQR